MLVNPDQNAFNFSYSNIGAVSTTPGTSVTPGVSNAEGNWTLIAAGSNLTTNIYGIALWVTNGASTATARNHALDIGIDPTGGSSYTAAISNLVCSMADTAIVGGRWFYFPYYINASAAVAVRAMYSGTPAGTIRVTAWFYGNPTNPENVRAGQYSETLGATASAIGTTFTPANSAGSGTWVSLGAPSAPLWWVQLGVGINNATVTSLMYHIDVGYGDSASKQIVIDRMPVSIAGTAETIATGPISHAFAHIPTSASVWVRGTCSGTAVTGFNATVIGIGG